MFSYELARQLKDAGFPFRNNFELRYFNEKKGGGIVFKDMDKFEEEGLIKIPTLSELIDACGDGFNNLTKYVGGWGTFTEYDDRIDLYSTPEEAIAKLWLLLNKN